MIIIREMKEEDIQTVVSFLDDTSEDFMNQWGGGRWYKYPVTVEQVINQFHTRTENTRYFVAVDSDTDEIVGSSELDFIDWENKNCAVCRYLIAPQHRNKGFGTETMKKLLDYAFSVLDMKRVNLTVFDFNISAHKCYIKAGFTEFARETRDNGWIAIKMGINNPKETVTFGEKILKIYFDSCIYNRPFDDQTQSKIQNETNAIMDIINAINENNYIVYSSLAVEMEIAKINNIDKLYKVSLFYKSIKPNKIKSNKSIDDRANELLSKYNIKYKDGLHIAYCELEKVDYLLSTDRLFISATSRANLKLKVINPIDFIEEVS